MCLGEQVSEKVKNKTIKKLTINGEYIRVYKVAVPKKRKYFKAEIFCSIYRQGIRRAVNNGKSPSADWGWHVFLNRKSAESWKGPDCVVIECLIKPEWIKDMGYYQLSLDILNHFITPNTATLKYICFPSFPNKKVTVRNFRKAYREWKNKNER